MFPPRNPYDLRAGSEMYSSGDSVTLYGGHTGAPWAVTNEGTIKNAYAGASGTAIQIDSGMIVNSNLIASTNGYALSIVNGGLVSNGTAGQITGIGAIHDGFGIAMAIFADTSLYLHYDGDIDGPSTSHAISADFRVSW